MIKIIIADDHELVRAGLKRILKEESDISVVGEASNGNELLDKLGKEKVNIVLLDMNMPGKSGIDLIKMLKKLYPVLHILVLSIYPEDKFALRTIKAGADGYVSKDSALEELVKAIRKISKNGKYISEKLAEQLANEAVSDNVKPPHELLSDREFEIMCMIASNKKVKEIADILSLSISTVNTYRFRILEKMKMKTDIELAHYAIRNNLLE